MSITAYKLTSLKKLTKYQLALVLIFLAILGVIYYFIHYFLKDKETFKLTYEEQAWIKRHPGIKVTGDPAYYPFDFLDKNGKRAGLARDYLDLIEKQLGIKFEYIPSATWSEVLEKAKKREVDIIANIASTSDRLSYLSFSESYYGLPYYVVSQKSDNEFNHLSQLKDKKLAMPRNYMITTFIKNNYPFYAYDEFDDNKKILELVNTKRYDATICDLATVSYYVGRDGMNNLKIIDEIGFTYDMRFAVPNDSIMLLHLLNKTLAYLPKPQLRKIKDKWINAKFDNYELFKQGVMVAAFVILIITGLLLFYVFLNKYLLKKVEIRTHELLEIKNNLDLLVQQQTYKLNEAVILLEKALEDKNMMLSVISHDLKNSFSSFVGITDILIRDGENISQNEKITILKEVNASANETYNLLLNLLQWSSSNFKQLPITLKEVDVDDLIEDIINQANPQASLKKVDIKFNRSKVNATTDSKRLETILRNLINNAIKYSRQNNYIVVALTQQKDVATISVSDRGVGMKQEYVDAIFNSDNISSSVGTKGEVGTGIGLIIVKQFVKDLGATISVESKENEGSTFSITLPLIQANVA
jgi:signal transduction histidine kinase